MSSLSHLQCSQPKYFLEYYHLKSAYDHLVKAEEIAKSVGDKNTLTYITNAICDIKPEAEHKFLYFLKQLPLLRRIMGDDKTSEIIHRTRMTIESAAFTAKAHSGGSDIADELLCAAEDLMPFDNHRWVHPVMGQSMGVIGGVIAVVGSSVFPGTNAGGDTKTKMAISTTSNSKSSSSRSNVSTSTTEFL